VEGVGGIGELPQIRLETERQDRRFGQIGAARPGLCVNLITLRLVEFDSNQSTN